VSEIAWPQTLGMVAARRSPQRGQGRASFVCSTYRLGRSRFWAREQRRGCRELDSAKLVDVLIRFGFIPVARRAGTMPYDVVRLVSRRAGSSGVLSQRVADGLIRLGARFTKDRSVGKAEADLGRL
jgi:hypothetical protein